MNSTSSTTTTTSTSSEISPFVHPSTLTAPKFITANKNTQGSFEPPSKKRLFETPDQFTTRRQREEGEKIYSQGLIFFNPDNSNTSIVWSTSYVGKRYKVDDHHCTCPFCDNSPTGSCKHRYAHQLLQTKGMLPDVVQPHELHIFIGKFDDLVSQCPYIKELLHECIPKYATLSPNLPSPLHHKFTIDIVEKMGPFLTNEIRHNFWRSSLEKWRRDNQRKTVTPVKGNFPSTPLSHSKTHSTAIHTQNNDKNNNDYDSNKNNINNNNIHNNNNDQQNPSTPPPQLVPFSTSSNEQTSQTLTPITTPTLLITNTPNTPISSLSTFTVTPQDQLVSKTQVSQDLTPNTNFLPSSVPNQNSTPKINHWKHKFTPKPQTKTTWMSRKLVFAPISEVEKKQKENLEILSTPEPKKMNLSSGDLPISPSSPTKPPLQITPHTKIEKNNPLTSTTTQQRTQPTQQQIEIPLPHTNTNTNTNAITNQTENTQNELSVPQLLTILKQPTDIPPSSTKKSRVMLEDIHKRMKLMELLQDKQLEQLRKFVG